jgi:hypothetical protein
VVAAAHELVEDRLGRAAGDDGVGDAVRVLLVRIARIRRRVHRRGQAGALLHDVGGLVRRRVQIGRRCEPDSLALRERRRTERRARLRGAAAHLRPDRRDVVPAERRLDRGAVRQLPARGGAGAPVSLCLTLSAGTGRPGALGRQPCVPRSAERTLGPCLELGEPLQPLGEPRRRSVVGVIARRAKAPLQRANRRHRRQAIRVCDRPRERRQRRAGLAAGSLEERDRVGRGVPGRHALGQRVLADAGPRLALDFPVAPGRAVIARRAPGMLFPAEPVVLELAHFVRPVSAGPASSCVQGPPKCVRSSKPSLTMRNAARATRARAGREDGPCEYSSAHRSRFQ